MNRDTLLDSILSELARPEMSAMADRLLDLRASAFSPEEAGRCVKIYFELLEASPDSGLLDGPLKSLRGWLEARLSIDVVDALRKERVERLPLRFRGESDLEDLCRSAMRDYHLDRCLMNRPIRMQFGLSDGVGDSFSQA